MGRRAVELVMQRLDNGRAGQVVLLPPVLTARASSAPAPLGR
jgi:DNA-binding LacI/PurR family transcriptional regulator